MSKNQKKRSNFTPTPNKFLFENRLSVDSEKLKMNPAMKLMYIVLEGKIARAGIEEIQIPLKDMAGFVCVADTKTVRTTKEKLEALGLIKTRVEKIPGTKGNEKTYWSIVKHFVFEMQEDQAEENTDQTDVVEKIYDDSQNETKVEEKIQVENTGADFAGKIPLDLEENFHEGVEENFHHPGGKIGQKRKDLIKTNKPKILKDKHVISINPEIGKLVSQYLSKHVSSEDVVGITKQFNLIFSKNQDQKRCEELMQFFVEKIESKKDTPKKIENYVGYSIFIKDKELEKPGYLQPRKLETAATQTNSMGYEMSVPKKIVRKEMVPSWLNKEDAPKEEKSKSREVLLEEATIMLDIQPDKLKPAHFKILEQEGLWDEAVQDAFEKSTANLRERLQKHDKVSVAK